MQHAVILMAGHRETLGPQRSGAPRGIHRLISHSFSRLSGTSLRQFADRAEFAQGRACIGLALNVGVAVLCSVLAHKNFVPCVGESVTSTETLSKCLIFRNRPIPGLVQPDRQDISPLDGFVGVTLQKRVPGALEPGVIDSSAE